MLLVTLIVEPVPVTGLPKPLQLTWFTFVLNNSWYDTLRNEGHDITTLWRSEDRRIVSWIGPTTGARHGIGASHRRTAKTMPVEAKPVVEISFLPVFI